MSRTFPVALAFTFPGLDAMLNWLFIKQVGLARWLVRTAVRQAYKRVLKRDLAMTLPTGSVFVIPPDSRIGSEVFVTGSDIDWGAEALFVSFTNSMTDFIDVGANIGYYSVYLAPRVRR